MAVSSSVRTFQSVELREFRRELERLRNENTRLARLVGLVGPRPLPDEAPRSPLFGGLPGTVDHSSSPADKVAFFRHLFAGREDVHDYVDASVPVLAYTHTERCTGYASPGFLSPIEL